MLSLDESLLIASVTFELYPLSGKCGDPHRATEQDWYKLLGHNPDCGPISKPIVVEPKCIFVGK